MTVTIQSRKSRFQFATSLLALGLVGIAGACSTAPKAPARDGLALPSESNPAQQTGANPTQAQEVQGPPETFWPASTERGR